MTQSGPDFSPEVIAQTALGLWDAWAEDVDSEEELRRQVCTELESYGF
jgi:hypothetical protein